MATQLAERFEAAPQPRHLRLVFFRSDTSGRCRRVEGFVAQVLQRRRNHETFAVVPVSQEKQPELFDALPHGQGADARRGRGQGRPAEAGAPAQLPRDRDCSSRPGSGEPREVFLSVHIHQLRGIELDRRGLELVECGRERELSDRSRRSSTDRALLR